MDITEVIINFLITAKNIDFEYLLEWAPTIYIRTKKKKKKEYPKLCHCYSHE